MIGMQSGYQEVSCPTVKDCGPVREEGNLSTNKEPAKVWNNFIYVPLVANDWNSILISGGSENPASPLSRLWWKYNALRVQRIKGTDDSLWNGRSSSCGSQRITLPGLQVD